MSRRHISLKTKLASTLLALGHIEYEHAKIMSARQICSLYQFDHYPIRHDDGGPDEPWNLVPRLILPHREKTAKIDRPQMAKADRLSAARVVHARALTRAAPLAPKRWPARKLQSRGFR